MIYWSVSLMLLILLQPGFNVGTKEGICLIDAVGIIRNPDSHPAILWLSSSDSTVLDLPTIMPKVKICAT